MRLAGWRAVLGGLLGSLLALPLVLLVGALIRPAQPEHGPGGMSISPLLDDEHRMRLSTYHRDCGLSAECEPPLGCLTETRARKQYCTDSQCSADAQCPEGQLCRLVATTGAGPLVRFCVPVGVRQEGESCIKIAEDKESACTSGLLCGGQQGWCARPCRKDDASCPGGFFCADTLPQPMCLPSCEARGCPAGQECIRFEEGVSVCAEVYGAQCQRSPCSEGRTCEVSVEPTRPGKVWMGCFARCGEGLPACTAGTVCDGGQCKPSCVPQTPESCGAGYRCRQRRPERPFMCQPDW
jgi:hypothetical protein